MRKICRLACLSLLLLSMYAAAQTHSIYNARWVSTTDSDGDGYYSSMTLEFDPDISSGYTDSVYVKAYWKSSTSTSYIQFATTPTYFISGSGTVYYGISVAPGSHGLYDYRLELFQKSTNLLVASLDGSADSDLNDHAEETASEDLAASVTYSIYSSDWSGSVDTDGDGYASTMNLSFDPDVSTGTATVYLRILRKLNTASSYTLIATTPNYTLSGVTSTLYSVAVSPGSHGLYDYRMEMYVASTDQMVATRDGSIDLDLSDHSEELSSEDGGAAQTLSLYDARWDSQIDNDGDGYYSSMSLSFDPDVSTGSATVYAKAYYKLSTSATYTLMTTTPDYLISGTSATYYSITVSPGYHALFDYRLELYNAADDQLVATRDGSVDSDLNDHPEEMASEDQITSVTYSIFSASWSGTVDTDGDGYFSSMNLSFDPDVSIGTATVYLRILRKLSTASSYTLIATTSNYTISGVDGTLYSVAVSPGSHGVYDYRLEMYVASTDQMVASRDGSIDTDLSDHLEELPSEDGTTQTFTLFNARWDNQIDGDGDGYFSSMSLSFDPDVSTGSASVYAKAYYKLSTSATYTLMATTPDYSISGSSATYYSITVTPGSHALFDYRLELYNAANDQLVATRDGSIDSDLNDHPEETASEDGITRSFTIFDVQWDSLTDADRDGYFSNMALSLDPDVSSGTASVYVNVYRKPASSSVYQLVATSPAWSISGTNVVYFGIPLSPATHGTYDYRLIMVDASTGLAVDTVGPETETILNDHAEETSSQDGAVSVLSRGVPIQNGMVYRESGAQLALIVSLAQSDVIVVQIMDCRGRIVWTSGSMPLPAGYNDLVVGRGVARGSYVLRVLGKSLSTSRSIAIR